MHADRHETEGGTVRIYDAGGVTEIPAASVAAFEQEDVAAAVPALPVAAPAPAGPSSPAEMAAQAAKKFALPESFIQSVMRAESAFRQDAISAKGAIGLMQLMPETAKELGVDPKDPQQNVDGGTHYLRDLLARYEASPDQVLLALAAYNAGPGAVEKYHGVPPYPETRAYILRILKGWNDSRNK
jgi:soluble lytic murein transglycosylase-like protein